MDVEFVVKGASQINEESNSYVAMTTLAFHAIAIGGAQSVALFRTKRSTSVSLEWDASNLLPEVLKRYICPIFNALADTVFSR